MSWRLAKSLVLLFAEVNAYAPERSRDLDGTIGDEAHAARASRHNPNAAGVVTACDITHDPEHGMNVRALFAWMCERPHPDLAYIITNGQVARRTTGFQPVPYQGSDMHLHHIHVAVGRGTDAKPTGPYDDTDTWLQGWKEEEDDMTPAQEKKLDKAVLSGAKASYVGAITNALLVGDRIEAARLNDAAHTLHPGIVTGLPKGWTP